MRLLPPVLHKQAGLSFSKMLGTGAGQGFSVKPDWSVYVVLGVWEDKVDYNNWLHSDAFQELKSQSDGQMEIVMNPYLSKGTWNGKSPFIANQKEQNSDLMGVITRASIKPSRLFSFWKEVPKVSKVISQQSSLLFQKGMGEWPLIEQATFSIWDAEAAMRDFAYKQKEHAKVVKLTRKLDWYSEEQFTRFNIESIQGSWPNSLFNTILNRSF